MQRLSVRSSEQSFMSLNKERGVFEKLGKLGIFQIGTIFNSAALQRTIEGCLRATIDTGSAGE